MEGRGAMGPPYRAEIGGEGCHGPGSRGHVLPPGPWTLDPFWVAQKAGHPLLGGDTVARGSAGEVSISPRSPLRRGNPPRWPPLISGLDYLLSSGVVVV